VDSAGLASPCRLVDEASPGTANSVLPFSPLEDARRLLCGIAERGRNAHGGERTERTSDAPVRLAAAREPVIVRSRGRCESPKSQAPSMTKRHPVNRSLDIDHVHDLGDGGADVPARQRQEDMLGVQANALDDLAAYPGKDRPVKAKSPGTLEGDRSPSRHCASG
jgi:hypothetical protein